MNILMCTDAYWPRINGVTVSVESFSQALIKGGHKVAVLCSMYPENQALENIQHFGSEAENAFKPLIIRVPSYPLSLSKEDRLAKIHKYFWVSKQLDDFKPDIIHIHSEFVIADFGFKYGKRNNIPIVYTFHTLWEEYIANYIPHVPEFILRSFVRRESKRIAQRADLIITPTQQIKDMTLSYKINKPTYLLPTGVDKILFSHNAHDIRVFRKKMETKFPQLKKKRILLFAGRISKEKNLSFLFKSLAPLFTEFSDLMLVLVGHGPDFEQFKTEARKENIEANCVFTGYLSRKDLSLTYAISHIFVFPSLTETQGLVTVEAMLSGVPVVAIGEMGTLTIMGGNNGGFMVKNDKQEFQSRVRDLLTNKTLYKEKSLEAKKHAQSWTIETMSTKLEEIYRQTITQKKGNSV